MLALELWGHILYRNKTNKPTLYPFFNFLRQSDIKRKMNFTE